MKTWIIPNNAQVMMMTMNHKVFFICRRVIKYVCVNKIDMSLVSSHKITSLEYLRSFRVYKIALFDVIATLIGAFLIMWFYRESLTVYDKFIIVLMVFMSGMIAHFYFKVNSTLNNYLFGC